MSCGPLLLLPRERGSGRSERRAQRAQDRVGQSAGAHPGERWREMAIGTKERATQVSDVRLLSFLSSSSPSSSTPSPSLSAFNSASTSSFNIPGFTNAFKCTNLTSPPPPPVPSVVVSSPTTSAPSGRRLRVCRRRRIDHSAGDPPPPALPPRGGVGVRVEPAAISSGACLVLLFVGEEKGREKNSRVSFF